MSPISPGIPGPAFLLGEPISLHPIEGSDLPFVAELRNDPEVRRTVYDHEPRNRRQVRRWWEAANPSKLEPVQTGLSRANPPLESNERGDYSHP